MTDIQEHSSSDERADRPLKFIFFPLSWLLAHVGRLVEIAKALRERGHEVLFAGADPAHPRSKLSMAIEAGFRVLRAKEPDHPYAWDRFVKYGWLITAWDLAVRHHDWAPLDEILEDQVRLIRQEQPDMVVGDGTVSVSTAAHITGIPAAGVLNGYVTRFVGRASVFMPLIYGWDALVLARLRKRVYARCNRRPVNAIRLMKSIPLISPDLPELYALPDGYPNWHTVGPIVSEPPAPLPDWYGELANGTPNVYITMGSTGILDTFLRRTFDGLARAPFRFLLTTGGQVSRETLALAPSNFRVAAYAPGAKLLEHCQALIFHGGNGTMYQGLAAGVPMIALPSHLEQETCADLCVRHGFGIKLRPRRVRAEELIRALQRLIADASYREAAQRFSHAVRAANGAQAAADLIERTAREGVPAGGQLAARVV